MSEHRRWRRQRRRHDEIENAVDDVAWGAGNLNRALEPRGCVIAGLGLLSAATVIVSAVGWRLIA